MKSEMDNKEILVEKFKVCTNKFVRFLWHTLLMVKAS
jgi:hypothetical protein